MLIKALRYAHDYTAQIPWATLDAARESLQLTHAFNEPNSADRLVLPAVLRRRVDNTVAPPKGGQALQPNAIAL